MIIPEDPDLTTRVRKYVHFVTQGKITSKSPVISRNGSKKVSGHSIDHNGEKAAYKIVPRVYWNCEVDGEQHVIRIETDETNLDIDKLEELEANLTFPISNYAPDFLYQMAKHPLFNKRFGNNPFWVIDHRYGPNSINRQADAYKLIKRVLMADDEYLKMMEQVNSAWKKCHEEKDELFKKFLEDGKQQIKREKDFTKKLIHFLSDQHAFTADVSAEILHFMINLDQEVLKDVGRFNKRNNHDIVYMKKHVVEEALNKAKVAVVMKS